MPNPKKSSKIPFLLAALIFLVLALIFFVLFIFYAYSGNYTDSSNNTVTYGGQTYKTVKIGEQTWMAENLNYDAEGSICYDDDPDNCAKYGRLYDWEAAMKACPNGWHLPDNAEWDKLLRFVDSDTGTRSLYESSTAGKHLKAASGWNEDGNGTDKYGFSALPGGHDHSYGRLGNDGIVSDYSFWWSASEGGSYGAYSRLMYYDDDYALWGSYYKNYMFSVRCVKD